ncbi:MAG: hypothetical protein ABEJ74_08235 [Haloferacaceae archaeon]
MTAIQPMWLLLTLMRLILFGVALGLTLISYQAYANKKTERLKYAFVGFAFVSMGVALSTLFTQYRIESPALQILETIPFIVGFSMLYVSMYR